MAATTNRTNGLEAQNTEGAEELRLGPTASLGAVELVEDLIESAQARRHLREHRVLVGAHDRLEQRLLVPEAHVNHPVAVARPLTDLSGGRAVEALLADQLDRRCKQTLGRLDNSLLL